MFTKTFNYSSFITRGDNWLSEALKRTFDVLISTLVLIILAPFLGIIALTIRRDSPGPAIYRGVRIGRGGKPFYILKFRTMYENPTSYSGPRVTAHDDPRVTRLGRWLRDTKLNELPQFWNVLQGEMSLVGPRPEDPSIAKTWPRNYWDEILSVRPGITSPASIQYHNEEALLAYCGVLQKYIQDLGPDKMRLDQLYVRYRSFSLDLDILLWTALIFIPKIGAMKLPEDLLFLGPFSRLIHRYLNWFTIDFFVTLVALSLTGLFWHTPEPLDIGWLKAFAIASGFAALFSLTGAVLGVNRIAWSKASFADAYELFPAWLIALAIVSFINWRLRLFPHVLVLVASIIALAGFYIVRYRSRLMIAFLVLILRRGTGAQAARERVLIVGSGRTAEHIAWLLEHPTYARMFQVVGFVEDNLMDKGMRIYGSQVVGACQDLVQLVNKHDVGLIFMADHHITPDQYHSIKDACFSLPAKIIFVPDIFGSLNNLIKAMPAYISTGEGRLDEDEFCCQRCLARFGAPVDDCELEDAYET